MERKSSQHIGLLEEAARLAFGAQLTDANLLKHLASISISATKAALPGFRRDQGFLWTTGRAQRLLLDLHAQHGVTPAEALRLIITQRILQDAADSRTSLREILQIKTLLMREDQVHLGGERLQHELQLKTRALDQKDQTIQLQLRRIQALETKVEEAASLTENASLTEQDRISQIRAIFGR